jgi:tripartite-type tricarboxylate transporter receptor subunit TctC
MLRSNRILMRALALAIAWCGAPLAMADSEYPTKPIRVIVPYSAGGGADAAARLIGLGLGTALGQTVVIDNRPGGGGAIGAALAAQAPADGYTMLYDASSFAINPALRKLTFDSKNDLVPLTQAVVMPDIMVVALNSPYKTFQDYIAAARAAPGKLTYASYGIGSSAHMIGEMLNNIAGVKTLHVAYKGGAPALLDVMAGHVDTYFASAASSTGLVATGKMRALAVTSPTRMKEFPDVPTIAESGFPGFQVMEWNGFFVPRNTPRPIVERLTTELRKIVVSGEVRDGLIKLGLTPVGGTSEAFGQVISSDMDRWSKLVKQSNIAAE